MKCDCEYRKLEEICTFINGLWTGEKPPFKKVGVIRNTNFSKDATLDDSDIAYLDVEVKKFEKRKLQYGDLILEKSGGGPKQPVGRVIVFDKTEGDFSFSNFTSALRINDPKVVDHRYLHKLLYWKYLSGVTETMQSHSTGIRNLNADAYKSIEIPISSLDEQRRVVEMLDKAFAGIARAKEIAEKNLANAKDLFASERHSILHEGATDWITVTLDKISTNLDSRRIPITKSDRKPGPYPYYGASGIVDYVANYIFEGNMLLISEDGANLLARSTPIAFSVSGKFWVNNHAHIVAFEEMATQHFVEHYLESISLEKYVTGAAQPKVTQQALNSIPITLPKTLSEREHIVNRLNTLQGLSVDLEKQYELKLEALDKLRISLLNLAFSGEL